jgi:hypothetical protein
MYVHEYTVKYTTASYTGRLLHVSAKELYFYLEEYALHDVILLIVFIYVYK